MLIKLINLIVAMLAWSAIPDKLSFQMQHCSLQSINTHVSWTQDWQKKSSSNNLETFNVWHNAQRSILVGAFGNQALSNGENNPQLLEHGSEWKMAKLFKHCLSVSVKLQSGLLHATLSIWRPLSRVPSGCNSLKRLPKLLGRSQLGPNCWGGDNCAQHIRDQSTGSTILGMI